MNINNLELKLQALELFHSKDISDSELIDIFMTVADDYTMNEVIDILNEE